MQSRNATEKHKITSKRKLRNTSAMPGKYLIKLEGFGGYGRADAFANHCRTCRTSNEVEVKSRIKEILNPEILWKSNRIRCMKSAMTTE